MIDEPRFRGIVQLLQRDPGSYRAFGPYWWPLKQMLRRHYATETLYLLGNHDEPVTRGALERHYPDEEALFVAAVNHYREKAVLGERYDGSSSLPDGADYALFDPDGGVANAVGS
jgi:hypothetical protein